MNNLLKNICRSDVAKSLYLALLLSFSSGVSAAPSGPKINPVELKRYLVFSQTAASKSAAAGAKVVRQTKGLTAVVCSPALAQTLGLSEDILVQAMDSAANTQVLATRVQNIGLTGRGRKIVVLDTGYNYNHPELRSSYLGGTNFVNNDDDPFDDNGHGSHVAGIITGDGIDPRARGIAPEAGIIAGKVLDVLGNGYISDIVAGIYWAVDGPDGVYGTADDFQADAINISIGSKGTDMYPSGFCDSVMPSLTDAINYAVGHGVPVVVAAGNNGPSGVSLPGCVSYATTVGAINHSNVLAYFSGVGPAVDIVAPGTAVYSASLGVSYKSLDGTSQATPMVSGTIALLKEAFPNASVDNVQQALLMTAADLGDEGEDNRYGWGRVDVFQALGALTTNQVAVTLALSRSLDQLAISWPSTPSGFILQVSRQFDLSTNGWCTVTNPIVATGDRNTTAVSLPAINQFYRLRWQ